MAAEVERHCRDLVEQAAETELLHPRLVSGVVENGLGPQSFVCGFPVRSTGISYNSDGSNRTYEPMKKALVSILIIVAAIAGLAQPASGARPDPGDYVDLGSIRTSICRPYPDVNRFYISIYFTTKKPMPEITGKRLFRRETIDETNPVVMTTVMTSRQMDYWLAEPTEAEIVIRFTDADIGDWSFLVLRANFLDTGCDRPNWEFDNKLIDQKRAQRRAQVREAQTRCNRLKTKAAKKK